MSLTIGTVGENVKDVPTELVCFLKYVTESTDACVKRSGNLRLEKIHERIKTLKQSRKLEERYMQFEEMLKREHREGYDEGLKAGQAERMQMLELISRMIDDGRTDMIPRLKTDETFYKEMLEKYHL